MKYLSILFLLVFGFTSYSQETEFGKTNNGLIYSDNTIKQLKFIVDSLNLKFKTCNLTTSYYSKSQTKANYILLEKGNIKEAKNDLDSNISYDNFINKYKKSEIEKELLVIKSKGKNYNEKDIIEFSSIELNRQYGHELNFENNLEIYDIPLKGKWVYNYVEKTEYSKEYIEAFYFIENFSQKAIPENYSRMIQYTDCMIDTTTQVFTEKAYNARQYRGDENIRTNVFMDYVNKSTKKPKDLEAFDDKDLDIYFEKIKVWDSLRVSRVDSLRLVDKDFDELLNKAIKEALVNGNSDDEFEEYVGRYISKNTELILKRNRIVVGGCSMDSSPRIHAFNIAKLSAETINWEVFLRSHLDIMNDRFDRVSDASYAWEQRKTYIKEIELLDINVLDLLLGISLRIENPNKNHYYGSIGRIGNALSETKNSNEIETKMLQMISDNQLDDYNRILIYYLFLNYNNSLKNQEKQITNKQKLSEAVKNLPHFISGKII
jgi:hypothetical protein